MSCLILLCLVAAIDFTNGFVPKYKSEMYDLILLNATELTPEDLQEALNPNEESGLYSTQSYDFFRNQDMRFPYLNEKNFHCYDNLISCKGQLLAAEKICAYNAYEGDHGQWRTDSICMMNYDNCKRGYRVWVLLGKGDCKHSKVGHPVAEDPLELKDEHRFHGGLPLELQI